MNAVDYKKLRITPSMGWWIRYYMRYYAGLIMSFIPLIAKIIHRIGYECTFIGDLGKEYDANLKYIKTLRSHNSAQNAQLFGSPYGYEDDFRELETTIKYCNQLKKHNFKNDISESAILYEHAINKLSQIFDKDNASGLVNFGVSHGYIDSVLAKKYPQIEFIGIDRSRFTKLHNESQFAELRNLKFVAGDIFDLLRSRRFDNYIFFHTRTCVLLPPDFITQLYKAVLSAGFSYVVGMEPVGVSRETSKVFEFSEKPKPSVLFRNFMFLHNYPSILKEAGLKLEDIELVKTNHPHEDLRILSYSARNGR